MYKGEHGLQGLYTESQVMSKEREGGIQQGCSSLCL